MEISSRTKLTETNTQNILTLTQAQSKDQSIDKDSGLGSRGGLLSSSSTEGDRPRVTRSKMRKPPVNHTVTVDTDDSDGMFTSPQGTVPRMTR